jgi:leader peptidase (prepilin peptidase) / N-methyltransferase
LDFNTIFHIFYTVTAGIYGLLIGSFLNVCIYRMPPRVFLFDDLFYNPKTDNIFTEIFSWFSSIFTKKGIEIPEKIEPVLYAESVVMLPLFPESAAVTAVSTAFNLYKCVFDEPMSISKPKRSFCPNCRKRIEWWMNIPVFSFIWLKGKCHYCKEKISWRYPLNELLSGIICAGLFYIYGVENFFIFLYFYILAAICIIVFYIDLNYWIIMDEITIPFTFIGILGSFLVPVSFYNPLAKYQLGNFLHYLDMPVLSNILHGFENWYGSLEKTGPAWLNLQSLVQSMSGAVLGYAFLFSIAVFGMLIARREAMGGGDIKFAMLMGAFLGIQKTGLAFFLAVILAVVFVLPGLITGRKTGKDQVPFGCFLTTATVLTIFFGEKIIEFYLKYTFLSAGGF